MEKQGASFYDVYDWRVICRIRTICIASGFVRRGYKFVVRYDRSVFRNPVASILYVYNFIKRNFPKVDGISFDVGQGGFFSKEKAAASNAVLQRNGGYRDRPIAIYDLTFCGVDSVENNFETDSLAEKIKLRLQKVL